MCAWLAGFVHGLANATPVRLVRLHELLVFFLPISPYQGNHLNGFNQTTRQSCGIFVFVLAHDIHTGPVFGLSQSATKQNGSFGSNQRHRKTRQGQKLVLMQ
jgi:hypothetical protein